MNKTLLFLMLFFISYSHDPAHAGENDVYEFEWLDKDKEIYVLQNRKFTKANKFQLSVLGGKTLSGKFIDSYLGVLKGAYFFKEDWGIELSYGLVKGKENNTADGVFEQGAVPFYRRIDDYKNLSVVWSPFYGKFNTFNLIYYVDWYVSAGFASISTSNNQNRFIVSSDDSLIKQSHTGGTWSSGFIFYLTQMFSLKLEFTGIHFQADKYREDRIGGTGDTFTTKQWFHNYDINAGVNFQF